MSEISYQILGSDLQYVEVTLPPQCSVIGEQGAMMYMDNYLDVKTILGDGNGFFSAIKRSTTGESLFSSQYTNNSNNHQRVAFASPTIGKIIAVNLSEVGGELICQRGAFLAGEVGTQVKLAWQKKMRVGFLGGEGFIMQKITGKGWVFINATGGLTEMHLAPNQTLQVDSGCWVASTSGVTYDIHYAGKVKTALFGGEGLFYASLTGPGTVWMQSLPMKRLSAELMSSAMTGRNRGGVWGRLYLIGIIMVIIASIFGGGN